MAENYVCDGAKLECKLCTKPEGELKVTSNEIKIQDKKFANAKDKEKTNLIFQGNCKKSPYQASACQAVIKTEEWQGIADAIIQDAPALLENSIIMCTYGGVPIKITDHLQKSVVTELIPTDVDGVAPDVKPKMLIESSEIIATERILRTVRETTEKALIKDKLKISVEKSSFVPLGIKDYEGNSENDTIKINVEVLDGEFESFDFYISYDKTTYHSIGSTVPANVLKKGDDLIYEWDGFTNDKYDSKKMVDGFKIKVEGYKKGKVLDDTTFAKHKATYDEVKWLDVKINKNTKRIDVTLRVNLKDGGEKGTKKDCRMVGSGQYAPMRTVCPWDKIPKKDLISGKAPIKQRTKSFNSLERMALDGLNYHWGRNKSHSIAKNVDISGQKYEVYINAINTNKNAMDDVELIFNTNRDWMRSGNPGTVDDPISFIGNIVSREAICYNIGYIKYSNGWGYSYSKNEDKEFKFTAAHEIGHTILKAYGGTFYSYGHKGSVNTVTQSVKKNAPAYPQSGEIDIMPYYPSNPPLRLYNRYVASEKDVLSLIWLTIINVK